jgi:hypothetical protein
MKRVTLRAALTACLFALASAGAGSAQAISFNSSSVASRVSPPTPYASGGGAPCAVAPVLRRQSPCRIGLADALTTASGGSLPRGLADRPDAGSDLCSSL